MKRPFSGVYEMNEKLISNWNSKVKKGDLVYHLGDWGFPGDVDGHNFHEIFDALNGQIILIMGNHDWRNLKPDELKRFLKVREIDYVRTEIGIKAMLCHYMMASWRSIQFGTYHLHGHHHGREKFLKTKAVDVGVDCHNFYPVSIQEIQEIVNEREKEK